MSSRRRFDIRDKAGAIVVVMLAGLGINVAITFAVNFPRSERAAALRGIEADHETRLTGRSKRVAALRHDFDRVIDGRRSLETFYDDVLSTKRQRMTAVQKEIRDIATRFNIKPESISYSRLMNKRGQIVKFSAILPLTGSYENLRAFINALEGSENFLIIESVQLQDSKEGGVILALQIGLATYFFDPEAGTPAPASLGAREEG